MNWNFFSKKKGELVLLDDGNPWALFQEIRDQAEITSKLGQKFSKNRNGYSGKEGDSLYYADHYYALTRRPILPKRKIAFCFYHGLPESGYPEFDEMFLSLKKRKKEFNRVRVTHQEMAVCMESAGFEKTQIYTIPIPINLSFFPIPSPQAKKEARERFKIPEGATVTGSFQKDGNGWEDGLTPKLIKGPDLLLKAWEKIRDKFPSLFVLLSGPARGYVKQGLDRLGIPYLHLPDVAEGDMQYLYHAIDFYIVASRQEGGPKSVFESMATGVPVISAKVGQARDLVGHGEEGWLVEIEDHEAMAGYAIQSLQMNPSEKQLLLGKARKLAESHSNLEQGLLWNNFYKGFVP